MPFKMCHWILLILLLYAAEGTEDHQGYVEMPGDVTVAGLFEIQSITQGGECGPYIARSVQTLESVRWVFKMLNDADYIPGIRIGMCIPSLPHPSPAIIAPLLRIYESFPRNSPKYIVILMLPGNLHQPMTTP